MRRLAESPDQRSSDRRLDRLLSALETLFSEQQDHLESENWSELAQTNDRAAALVAEIAPLLAQAAAAHRLRPETLARARQLAQQQTDRVAHLQQKRAASVLELADLRTAGGRLAKLAPAYGSPSFGPPNPSRFTAQG